MSYSLLACLPVQADFSASTTISSRSRSSLYSAIYPYRFLTPELPLWLTHTSCS